MKTSRTPFLTIVPGVGLLFLATSLLAAMALAVPIAAQAADRTRSGRKFATPEEAVAALRAATTKADTNALMDILGPASEDLLNPDRIQATNELKTFSAALTGTNQLLRTSDSLVILQVGDDLWPFPVPIVRKEGPHNSGSRRLRFRQ